MLATTQPHEIVQLGAPVLRCMAMQVNNINSTETKTIIEHMRTALASTQGVGLAAPQIGVSKRIIIVASRPTARYPKAPLMQPTVMVNPEFTALSEEKIKDWEGCLSVPGIRALVPRWQKIAIQYLDESGKAVSQILEDFTARIFQHEFDHLDGLVFLDRVEISRDIVAESEYLKLIHS